MACLLIDSGNTRLKWSLETAGRIIASGFVNNADLLQSGWVGEEAWRVATQVYACSVAGSKVLGRIEGSLTSMGLRFDYLAESEAAGGGVVNAYEDFRKLGLDRWLAILAGKASSERAFCVLDCGSAITMDFVGKDGVHHGGYIIPGVKLLSEVLLSSTARIDSGFSAELLTFSPGKNTGECVSAGVGWMLKSLELAISAWKERYELDTVDVFLTGGDADLVQKALSMRCIVNQRMVFEGLVLQASRLAGER